MSLFHGNASSTTTAQPLVTIGPVKDYVAVSIQNNHSASVFVGDKTITTSGATQGHTIAAGATYQLWLSAGDTVYVISAASTAAGAISVLYSGA
jgi:hypothetical protein